MNTVLGKTVDQWIAEYPLLAQLRELKVSSWFNPAIKPAADGLAEVGLSMDDIYDAENRLKRFAPYIAKVFPETKHLDGIIESPIARIPAMQQALAQRYGRELTGKLWTKLDSHLPISGSIKARGGIYEVLQHAENLAIAAGKLSLEDDYRKLDSAEFKEFFGQHKVAVGSTGNLGLSIGIMSAQLGFQASVHMSSDARQWKKDMLRSHGVTVVEYDSDYSVAVAQGRKEAEGDPSNYFVDDENSQTLFLGYSVAAVRLAGQLQSLSVKVDEDHPLFVYLPCGVGGGPGGVAFGLKSVFGDHVHCVFAEPTHCPSMLIGVYTGEHDNVSVNDFGIDNVTAADGLACGRPSGFVGGRMQHLLDGFYTVDDDEMFRLIALLHRTEELEIEPSAATGLVGPWHVLPDDEYLNRIGMDEQKLANATHIAWATGGAMVPEAEMNSYLKQGQGLL